MVHVQAVESPGDFREFVDLPALVYGGMAGFEAPLRIDRAMLLDREQSPFWIDGRAQFWIARVGGQPVGRMSAQIGGATPVGVAADCGMFGCLDAIDDAAVVAGLLDAAQDWLRAQGCASLFGPCTLDMNDEPGLLVEGQAEPAMTLCPWHPPYLERHLLAAGLVRLHDLHNWRLDLAPGLPRLGEGQRRLLARVPGLKIRSASRRHFRRDIRILCDLYNDGWWDKWGFIPLAPVDLDGLDVLMRWLVPREAFRIAELDGRPVGVMLLIPNLFEVTRGLGPAPGLAGWLRLAWRALTHRYRSGRVIVMGVAKALQASVTGAAIASLLVDDLVAAHAALGGDWVEAGWVLEENVQLRRILERFGFRRNKTFRLFAKPIAVAPMAAPVTAAGAA